MTPVSLQPTMWQESRENRSLYVSEYWTSLVVDVLPGLGPDGARAAECKAELIQP